MTPSATGHVTFVALMWVKNPDETEPEQLVVAAGAAAGSSRIAATATASGVSFMGRRSQGAMTAVKRSTPPPSPQDS